MFMLPPNLTKDTKGSTQVKKEATNQKLNIDSCTNDDEMNNVGDGKIEASELASVGKIWLPKRIEISELQARYDQHKHDDPSQADARDRCTPHAPGGVPARPPPGVGAGTLGLAPRIENK